MSAARRRGATLIELSIALLVFAAVGYGLAVLLKVGTDSQDQILRERNENRTLRETTGALVDELATARTASVTVTTLADGNHQVRFMQPVEVAGVLTWGVFDRELGATPDEQNRANWCVQYTVRDARDVHGAPSKKLVRQVLDDTLTMQREEIVLEGLRSGRDASPGFRMTRTGDVWELVLSTADSHGGSGTQLVFHVRTLN